MARRNKPALVGEIASDNLLQARKILIYTPPPSGQASLGTWSSITFRYQQWPFA